MAKKPVEKGSGARSKKGGKIKDLPAKSLGADKASSVKGGFGGEDWGLKSGNQSLKFLKTGLKVGQGFLKIEHK
jgi:hypothetical protein